MLSFVRFFPTLIDVIVSFFFFTVNVVDYNNCFSLIESAIHPCSKPQMVMSYYSSYVVEFQFLIFVEEFKIYIHEGLFVSVYIKVLILS